MEITIPETRGRKKKYLFDSKLKKGESIAFDGTINIVSTLARKWQKENKPTWKFRCYTHPVTKYIIVTRTK